MGDAERQWPIGKGGNVSKQFQPRKYKDGGEEWRKTEALTQQLCGYTPFKTNSMSRATTPLTPISEQNSLNGSICRSGKSHPFEYQNHSASPNPFQIIVPPSAGYRSVSAMGQPPRALSRQSDVGIGQCVGPRYQSYCTLPRPEEVDVGTLNDMHSNLHAFYSNMPSKVLCSLTIFGIGVGRMLEGAKWGIGIELAYALVVLAVGLGGVYSARRRSYVAATFAFSLNTFCMILAAPSFMIGLFPAIPWAFAEATPSVWSSNREPLELDFGLSLIIFIQVLLSMALSIYGYQAAGALCAIVEDVRLGQGMQSAFHDIEIPHKV
uniref:DUF4203 domain-containing protein n=1 Tax=Angiostrongylus cantonensis TaxID=6313 RepID=A0A0K0CSX7_ANGCA